MNMKETYRQKLRLSWINESAEIDKLKAKADKVADKANADIKV